MIDRALLKIGPAPLFLMNGVIGLSRATICLMPTGFCAIAMMCSSFAHAAQPLVQIEDNSSPDERVIRNYATSLVQVEQVQSTFASNIAALPPAERAALENDARKRIEEILSEHDLDVATFNAISLRVDRSASLQRQVRQFAMEERIGF